MDRLTYYGITGMLAVENNGIATLKKRISILAERRPELCRLITEGVAVAVHVMNNAKLCKLLGVKTAENVKCNVVTNGYLQQKVYIEYDCEGKHRCDTYNLPLDVEKLKEVLDVEYEQPQCLAAWKDRHFKSPDESLKIKTKHSLCIMRVSGYHKDVHACHFAQMAVELS